MAKILSSVELLFHKELFHQSSFYLIKILFNQRSFHQSGGNVYMCCWSMLYATATLTNIYISNTIYFIWNFLLFMVNMYLRL